MLSYLQALEEDVDYESFPTKPDWFDQGKFDKGRKFFLENSLAVLFSHMVFLMLGMCVQRFVRVLVMTGKSSTPGDAVKRYRKTGEYLGKWYNGSDPWDAGAESHKAIASVRRMHKEASRMLEAKRPVDIGSRQPVSSVEYEFRARKLLEDVRMDVENSASLLDEAFTNKVSWKPPFCISTRVQRK
jgi:hypothetical protein